MAILKVVKNGVIKEIPFEPPMRIMDVLERGRIMVPHPCGGFGRCLKCRVHAEGTLSVMTETEKKIGSRLTCISQLFGDAVVYLKEQGEIEVETGGSAVHADAGVQDDVFRCAVDIGTTTVAVKILKGGETVYTGGVLNPQTAVAADVMGRIGAAKEGPESRKKLQEMITEAIRKLTEESGVSDVIESYVITGNTTMLYLLTGKDPDALSHAPFEADDLYDREIEFLGKPAYLPKCMHAFVGADITTAVFASGMCEKSETALLCDVGTNGEVALWKNGTLYVTSTAAGPAFEGAGIQMGSGSVPGAIDSVSVEDGKLKVHTIGGEQPGSICGSGLIDAVAAGLTLEVIDETGLIDEDIAEELCGFETEDLVLSGNVVLTQQDIRAVQLAKAAVKAGIMTLLEVSDTSAEEISCFYIAGGFGSHLNVSSAVRIGLFPAEFAGKTRVLGNAALAGAEMILTKKETRTKLQEIASYAQHVNLGGNAVFNEFYMDEMMFGAD